MTNMTTNIKPKCFGTVRAIDHLDGFVATTFPLEEEKAQREQDRGLLVPARPQDKKDEVSNFYRK